MIKFGAKAAVLVMMVASACARGDGPPTVPSDFKIQVASYALKKEPVFTEEILIRQGRIYVFASDTKEVVLIEPARKQLDLLDVGRKLQAEVSFRALDESLERLRKNLREAAEARENQGSRGKVLEARMTRDLFEAKLKIAENPRVHQIRLTNPTVEVDAVGEPDADTVRLSLVTTTLGTIARLGAFRAPTDLPPFVELEAIAALTGDRRLRPTELAYLYRLAGPPRKFRRTYKLVPTLTDREVEAVARLDRFRESVTHVRYEQYRTDR